MKFFVTLFKTGHYVVDLFIVLSGFCLMLPVIRHRGTLPGNTIIFFKKRIRRILPPYYLAMGFSLLLIITMIGEKTGTRWDISIPITLVDAPILIPFLIMLLPTVVISYLFFLVCEKPFIRKAK